MLHLSERTPLKVYSKMCSMAVASTPAAMYIWVLWNQLQSYLNTKERKGAYLTGGIRRCAPESKIDDLTELSTLSPTILHKVIESLKIRIEIEKEKMADVPF